MGELITQAQGTKLQRLVRQTQAYATWKGLRNRVRNLTRDGNLGSGDALDDDDSERVAKRARADRRFISFVSVDHFSRAPMVAMCSEAPFRNDEFIEFIAHYFGLPSPACRTIAGNRIRRGQNKSFHVVADPEGVNLLTAGNGTGGLRLAQHNELQNSLVKEAVRAGIPALTGQVIGTEEALRSSNWQGPAVVMNPNDDEHPATRIRPDVIIDFQTHQQVPFPPRERPPQGSKMLLDIKTLGLCQNAPYFSEAAFCMGPDLALGQESLAVRKRADQVNREYLAKARKRDARFTGNSANSNRTQEREGASENSPNNSPNTTREGEQGTTTTNNNNTNRVGPYTHTIRSYGQVKGMVIGAFGELSAEWDTLISYIAKKRAAYTNRVSGSTLDVKQMASRYRWLVSNHIGNIGMRGIVNLKLRVASESYPLRSAILKPRASRYHDAEVQGLFEQRPRVGGGGFSMWQ